MSLLVRPQILLGQSSTLITSFILHSLFTPTTMTLGVRDPMCDFWENTIQSIACGYNSICTFLNPCHPRTGELTAREAATHGKKAFREE